jgi:hypothetical protein
MASGLRLRVEVELTKTLLLFEWLSTVRTSGQHKEGVHHDLLPVLFSIGHLCRNPAVPVGAPVRQTPLGGFR